MRINSKLRTTAAASAALLCALAAGDALAWGHGGGGGHWTGGAALGPGAGHHAPNVGGRHVGAGFVGLTGGAGAAYGAAHAYHGYARQQGYGYGGGGYWGGYYGGGGVYYGDAGYGGGYYDQYATGRPTAYTAATCGYSDAPTCAPAVNYERAYQVPVTSYQPVVQTRVEPVVTYHSSARIIYLPTTHYRAVRDNCNCY